MSAHQDIVAAVHAGDTAKVRALLAADPSLAAVRVGHNSLLLIAVYSGARDAADLIRSRRTDLDVFEAAAVGDTAALGALLPRDPGATRRFSPDGFTPLALAAFFGQAAAVGVLLDHGADVNRMGESTAPNVPKNTALHAALAGRAWEAAEVLLDRGADVRARDEGGRTPLHIAAIHGGARLVELLLASGAEVGARDGAGKTALAWAVERGQEEAAAVLRRHGATD